MSQTAVIAGVGPGLGESLVRIFAENGSTVVFLSRTPEYLEELESDLREDGHEALGIECDVRSPISIATAFSTARETVGPPDVLIYNASGGGWGGLFNISRGAFRDAWETTVFGAFCCVRAVVPDMLESGEGTLIFTGATSSIRGRSGAIGFSMAKFGLRGLAESLAQEFGTDGITVAHVVIDGQIRPPEGPPADSDPDAFLDPGELAETYWHLAQQKPETMSFETHVTNGTRTIEFL